MVSFIEQEGLARQKPTTGEPVSTSTQQDAQKEKHKWSWASKGKTIANLWDEASEMFSRMGRKQRGASRGEKAERVRL
jgi:hypothetical protein